MTGPGTEAQQIRANAVHEAVLFLTMRAKEAGEPTYRVSDVIAVAEHIAGYVTGEGSEEG